MLAVVGFEVGFFVAARAATVLALAFGLVYHGGRHDTCGDSDDGITQNHDDAGKEASYEGDRCDVAIADGCEGDNRPVDAGADVRELRAWLVSLDDEHESSDDGNEDEDEEEIDEYLTETQADTLQEQVALVDEGEELEHTEDTYESEHTQDKEVACRRETWNEGKIERQGRQKVDDTKETEGIVLGARRAVKSKDVLDGEEEGENILQYGKHVLETSHHRWFGLDERDNEAEDDGNHHRDVECLTRLGVGIEHDIVEALLVFEQCYKLFHGCKVSKKF